MEGCRARWAVSTWPGLLRTAGTSRLRPPGVLDVVHLPDLVPGDGQQLFDVSTAGVNCADTHHRLAAN
jgi:hypothetical protein